MEHKQTSISLPGYYNCDVANRQQDSNDRVDQQFTYDDEKVTETTLKCVLHLRGNSCISALQSEAASRVAKFSLPGFLQELGWQWQVTKLSLLKVSARQRASFFFSTVRKCFHLEEHLVSL